MFGVRRYLYSRSSPAPRHACALNFNEYQCGIKSVNDYELMAMYLARDVCFFLPSFSSPVERERDTHNSDDGIRFGILLIYCLLLCIFVCVHVNVCNCEDAVKHTYKFDQCDTQRTTSMLLLSTCLQIRTRLYHYTVYSMYRIYVHMCKRVRS